MVKAAEISAKEAHPTLPRIVLVSSGAFYLTQVTSEERKSPNVLEKLNDAKYIDEPGYVTTPYTRFPTDCPFSVLSRRYHITKRMLLSTFEIQSILTYLPDQFSTSGSFVLYPAIYRAPLQHLHQTDPYPLFAQ